VRLALPGFQEAAWKWSSPSPGTLRGAYQQECYSQEVLVPVTGFDEELLVEDLLDEELLDEELLVPLVFPPCCFKKLLLFLDDELDVEFVLEDPDEI